MVNLSLEQIAAKTGGVILQGSPSLTFSRFNIDSRQTKPGELFFALIANRDGHDFVPEAISKGAAAAVISRKIDSLPNKVGLIKVKDTLLALQQLASQVLSEYQVKVVGITGSSGKTTTKEFAACLLEPVFNVLKSKGNFNNQIGLPLSLLSLNNKHEVAVLDMAMSAAGEIRTLTQIAPPDVGVITNISPVHLQFFKNIREIGEAKKEILEGTKPEGAAVINGDDPLVKNIAKDWKGEKIFFGLSPQCQIKAEQIKKRGFKGMTFDFVYGSYHKKIDFPFFYDSFLYNFLAAAAVSFILKVPFEALLKQIKKLKPLPGRGVLIHLQNNIKIFDESYNSNPKALEAALRGLSTLPSRRKVAVLADMLELGEKEVEFHRQAGAEVSQWGWDRLITIGPLSTHLAKGAMAAGMKKNQIDIFQNSEQAAARIQYLVEEGDFVLVKGSRKMETEKIIEKLKSIES